MTSQWNTVGHVMTHEAVAVGRDATFQEVLGTLQRWKVSALPVLAGDARVIGVVSEADLLEAEDREGGRTEGLTAGVLMSVPAVTVHPDSPTGEAARAMARGHFKRLPVVDADGCLTGIVSRSDLLKVHLRTDEDLADDVRFELLAVLKPAVAAALDVRAEEGRITLTGSVPDPSTLPLLERIVRAVPGVVHAEVRVVASPD
ncbi:CBS domain-containing protein [Kitasatospora sp. NBC_01539]|uniref:CBS domain-containing protein n=1 Tax=Kitasatospora sp. NBC_01539 TaxID=2903577 RepID=UPI0038601008